MTRLEPGAQIGILGGGQLGRMLALAAAELGFDVIIYTPDDDSPASRVAKYTIVADYDDIGALTHFAEAVSVVTYEFENVPADTARYIESRGVPVRPGVTALETAQDRVTEKGFFAEHGVATAPYAAIDSEADLTAALDRIGAPAILKTRRLGYDGQGQARIATLDDASAAYAAMKGAPAILEGFCAFEREVSIIAARSEAGLVAFYDLAENVHADGILATTRVPANASRETALAAQQAAHTILDALDYVGVLAIEFFQMPDGALIANEMAPRVHNSGHWTQDACLISQFEQHIRAVAGWPLASTWRYADAEMTNLIGEDERAWPKLAAAADTRLHLYGKRDARPGRKMGHATKLKPRT